ncbi:MAG: DUF4492 domain-containing protein [Muribaculaceae bacterium]|nr:DUF4492 domain-containing protein [Muribaculaceae bacterium]
MKRSGNIFAGVLNFYVEGFRRMTVGRTLWAIIIIKLVVIFAVLKLFFFPDILATRYHNDEDRAAAVREALSHNPETPKL